MPASLRVDTRVGVALVMACAAASLGARCGKRRNSTKAPGISVPRRIKRPGKPPADMVSVPKGCFQMSDAHGERMNNQRMHKVCLDSFYIDRYEVTVKRYAECVRARACTAPKVYQPAGSKQNMSKWGAPTQETCNWGWRGHEEHPVNCVTWFQARKYCQWRKRRLPTEAEWERAARGDDGRRYPWGNEKATCKHTVMTKMLPDDGRGCGGAGGRCHGPGGCGKEHTLKVGSKPLDRSPYGAYDMAGNISEWVADWFDAGYYDVSPVHNPRGPKQGEPTLPGRLVRGGDYESLAAAVKVTSRGSSLNPKDFSQLVGFRCAADAR